MKYFLLLLTAIALSGCIFTSPNHEQIPVPLDWTSQKTAQAGDIEALHGWWKNFNDPVLNNLIDTAVKNGPDKKIAEARVLEARGLRQIARSALFPQIGVSADAGRQKNAISNFESGNYYDAGFDASYELDIFGRNRNTSSAAVSNLKARLSDADNINLTLTAEVSRVYVEFRFAEKQAAIARKNLDYQQKTLDLVKRQKEFGEAPQLDVERAEGLVNTTKSAIPEFERQADNARLQLTVLTGSLPETVSSLLKTDTVPTLTAIKPLLLTPAQVIAIRPDIQAAQSDLETQTSLTKAQVANIFPTVSLAGFFGIAESTLIDPARVWSASINTAVSLLDFGRIQGGIDAQAARETQAFEIWRKTVLQAVTDVETALTDYAHINERFITLQQAKINAQHSLDLSQQLYKEGEISFLDVLDAQRTVNNADAETLETEKAQLISLISLYKALGVY